MKILFTTLQFCVFSLLAIGQTQLHTIKGKITDVDQTPIPNTNIQLEGTTIGTAADRHGSYELKNIPGGTYELLITSVGFNLVRKKVNLKAKETLVLNIQLTSNAKELEVLEIAANKKKVVNLTQMVRLSVPLQDQPQTVSVIDREVMDQQGVTGLKEVIKNIPGVYNWATFGDASNSFGARGYRNITYLKNGVPIYNTVPEMDGIENVQVIKGASAILFGNVSPGGIINLQTKRPLYEKGGKVGLRYGSFETIRQNLDFWGNLDDEKKMAYRINTSFEKGNGFRDHITKQRFYINPSFAMKLSDKAELILEYDYFNNSFTPDNGTILYNNEIYDLPFDRFTGFASDRVNNNSQSFIASLNYRLNENLSLRVVANRSADLQDSHRTSNHSNVLEGTSLLKRAISKSDRAYTYQMYQVDLLGKEVKTGSISHAFQLGIDHLNRQYERTYFTTAVVDTIDVINGKINNSVDLPNLAKESIYSNTNYKVGFTTQDIVKLHEKLLLAAGARFTLVGDYANRQYLIKGDYQTTPFTSTNGWSPFAGLTYKPFKQLSVFGSYTNTFQPTTYKDKAGNNLGNQITDQAEVGFKSTFFEDMLKVNLTYYRIFDDNQIVPAFAIDENGVWKDLGYYEKSGSLLNSGAELEIEVRPFKDLYILTGYSYVDATYLKSDKYSDGASPFNTPAHTANLWVNYELSNGLLKGLSFGTGVYYNGERWGNDQVKRPWHGIDPSVPTHKLAAYTELNASIGYVFKQWQLNLYANNITDERAYLSYRSNYINPITPRNFAASIAYSF